MSRKLRLIVVGNGMVGHRLIERLLESGGADAFQLTLLAEEPRLAYDRVNLSKLFDGKTATDLALASLERYVAAGHRSASGRRGGRARSARASGSAPGAGPS